VEGTTSKKNHVYCLGCVCDGENQLAHICLKGADIEHLLEDQLNIFYLSISRHGDLVKFCIKKIRKEILKLHAKLLEGEIETEKREHITKPPLNDLRQLRSNRHPESSS
jgi:hypothetical protein